MKLKLIFVLMLSAVITSCQFNESMVLNDDGSGTLEMDIDLSQLMEITQSMGGESVEVFKDTTIFLREFLESKKDSISRLPKEEQEVLSKLENYRIRFQSNTDEGKTVYSVATDFKDITELDNLHDLLNRLNDLAPSSQETTGLRSDQNAKEPDIVGVRYSLKNNVFTRDAYIKDEKLFKQQMDSLEMAEAFFAGSIYSLSYTFPRKIKKISNSNAMKSNGGKTVILRVPFLDYYKNPDVLDLTVELE